MEPERQDLRDGARSRGQRFPHWRPAPSGARAGGGEMVVAPAGGMRVRFLGRAGELLTRLDGALLCSERPHRRTKDPAPNHGSCQWQL